MHIDWSGITTQAYQTLLRMDIVEFPLEIKHIKYPNTIITSYQEYSRKTGVPLSLISQNGTFEDAFVVRNLRPNLVLILYNQDTYDPRKKHSILHEVGHVACNHRQHGSIEETEAHYFASQVNAPNAIIRAVALRGHKIEISLLMRVFGLSMESAQKKIDYLQKHPFTHKNEFDDVIVCKFQGFIDKSFPFAPQARFDDYFDDMEAERSKW